jgi:hypothetical protein
MMRDERKILGEDGSRRIEQQRLFPIRSRRDSIYDSTPSGPDSSIAYKITPHPVDPALAPLRMGNVRDSSRTRRSTIDSNARPIVVTAVSQGAQARPRRTEELGRRARRYERHGGPVAYAPSPPMAEESEATMSDFSSESGDEESTLVEDKGDGEELHLSQQEAQAMMMNFLATFTAV